MKLLFMLIFFLPCNASTNAQSELEIFAGASFPGSKLGSDPALRTDFKNGVLFGARVGSRKGIIGAEFSYTLLNLETEFRSSVGFDSQLHLLAGNLLLEAPAWETVPFATFGLGVILGRTQHTSKVGNSLAWNAGGGVKIRNLPGPLGLRFDVRYHRSPGGIEVFSPLNAPVPRPPTEIVFDFVEASAGLLMQF